MFQVQELSFLEKIELWEVHKLILLIEVYFGSFKYIFSVN